MNRSLKSAIALVSFSFISFSFLSAQSKNAVILIDGQAKQVKIAPDGTVLEVIKDLPNYLDNESHPSLEYQNTGDYAIAADYDLDPGSKYIEHEMIRTGAFRIIYFPTGKATFSNATVRKLKEIVNRAKSSDQMIIMESFYDSQNMQSKKLVSNRAIACKQFLLLNGIPENRVLFAIKSASEERAKINVFLK